LGPESSSHTFRSITASFGFEEVSKLLRHASIQMTERYAHLAPDYLHDAVDNLGFSARFQHTDKSKKAVLYQNVGNTSVKWSG
jgi:hypothetical protein